MCEHIVVFNLLSSNDFHGPLMNIIKKETRTTMVVLGTGIIQLYLKSTYACIQAQTTPVYKYKIATTSGVSITSQYCISSMLLLVSCYMVLGARHVRRKKNQSNEIGIWCQYSANSNLLRTVRVSVTTTKCKINFSPR